MGGVVTRRTARRTAWFLRFTHNVHGGAVRGKLARLLNADAEEVDVKQFLKWTLITAAGAASATLAYRWMSALRTQLERGLERVERVAEDARTAVAHTQEALGQTAQTARDIRRTIGS